MTVRIWTAACWKSVYRCGGWAYVREGPAHLAGSAGGDRNTTLEQMALAGLAAALKTLPKAETPVVVHTPHMDLVALSSQLATRTAPETSPMQLNPAWQAILQLSAARSIKIVLDQPSANTPIAFVLAWADFAQDKAKSGGHFISPIPKPNLAKMPRLIVS